MGTYPHEIPGLKQFVHRELVKLGLTTDEKIQAAEEKAAQEESANSGQHSEKETGSAS